jgi:hypothetical protein
MHMCVRMQGAIYRDAHVVAMASAMADSIVTATGTVNAAVGSGHEQRCDEPYHDRAAN